ncbi:acyl-CoA dehydrogenase family protein [Fusibacter paucivorans]|uniref:Acyl-CoA dehydrogenase family protein n=1 Tax=Fusibacter paucivorans TaxID=76009 RepID=A0ABS5PTS6_9FIRM|nr:acyl-CoA dehydrogenase family protein [Fusibacter paucivorans]MBS7528575.1 acyl-CoA dehydrogenase family protein [Fusibacter paucivorans]
MNQPECIQNELLRKTVRQFIENEIEPHAKEMDLTGEFPWQVIKKMAKLGMFGVAIDESWGGAGMNADAEVIVLEELARSSASVALTLDAHNLALYPIYHHADEALKKRVMKSLATGEKLCAFGLTEPGCGSDAANIQCTAVKKQDHYVLNGQKAWLTNFSVSDYYVIAAKTDRSAGARGVSLFLVERDNPGLHIGQEEDKFGMRGSNTGEITLENCEIPLENLIGIENKGFAYAMETLDIGRMAIGAIAIGIIVRALEEAKAYAQQRAAFGKPIAKYQAVQFMIADMEINLFASRTMLRNVVAKRNRGENITQDVAKLKVFSSEAATKAALDAIQIFGGNGYSKEYPVERLMRDAKLLEIGEGTTQILRMLIGANTLR